MSHVADLRRAASDEYRIYVQESKLRETLDLYRLAWKHLKGELKDYINWDSFIHNFKLSVFLISSNENYTLIHLDLKPDWSNEKIRFVLKRRLNFVPGLYENDSELVYHTNGNGSALFSTETGNYKSILVALGSLEKDD